MDVFWLNLSLILGLMTMVWLLSLPLRDVSIVDIFWGLGFVVVTWSTLLQTGHWSFWRIILACMATIWGLRLSGYLLWRNWGKGEDYRYQSLRNRFGSGFPVLSLVIVFLFQGALIWIVSLPLQSALSVTEPPLLMWLMIVGGLFWLMGLLFEAVGDYQLARFKADSSNSGKVLDRGLWRYTRHPNYFGDFLVWWGLGFTSIALGADWWTLIGPVIMSVFLMKISGVTLLESSLKERKPEYQEYIRRTNAFFPGPPKSM
ncbi:MAG: DUF1295 domain-containing protein [Planctomycetaceae bacterium]